MWNASPRQSVIRGYLGVQNLELAGIRDQLVNSSVKLNTHHKLKMPRTMPNLEWARCYFDCRRQARPSRMSWNDLGWNWSRSSRRRIPQ